jgi:hypothetical protein
MISRKAKTVAVENMLTSPGVVYEGSSDPGF